MPFILVDEDYDMDYTDYGCSEEILKFYKDQVNSGNGREALQVVSHQPRLLGMLFNTDGQSCTLIKDKGSVGYLPTGHAFRFHLYDMLPCSMIRKSFYDEHITGKTVPWLNSTYLTFDAYSTIPYRPRSPLMVKSFGSLMDFAKITKVHGIGLLPFVVGGIPCLAQVLIVDDIFPNQPPIVNATRFDVILDIDIFSKFGDTVRRIVQDFDKTLAIGADQAEGTIAKLKITTGSDGKRVLSVWVDGCCVNNGSKDIESIKGGIGVFYAAQSAFNISLPAKSSTHEIPMTSQRAELLAGIKALRQILTFQHYHGYIFDLAEIYSDSEYLVRGVTELLERWKARQWRSGRGTLIENKDLWIKIDELVSKNFRTQNDSNDDRIKLELSWFRVPRTETVEADNLAKTGAERGSPASAMKKLDLYDQGESVKRLGLGCEGGPNSPQAVNVKVVHAGVKLLGVPDGYSLVAPAAQVIERTL